MNNSLEEKIARLNLAKPWVWELGLTKDDFVILENILSEKFKFSKCHDSNQNQKTALCIIVYLALWYQFYYESGNTNNVLNLDSGDLERIWKASGINIDLYVYKDDNGNRRWLYSIYVLGGLAINHELQRNDNGRFLRGLCRIYHGEDYSLDNIDDDARATAFKESIKNQHSLYHYIKSVLNNEIDNSLAQAIRSANEEVYRDKFSLEWAVITQNNSDIMHPIIRLRQNPEEVGEGLHQYLRYDRVLLWGIDSPHKIRNLSLSVCYKVDECIVKDSDFSNPLVVWSNTGDENSGFISWAIKKLVENRNVPVSFFDSVELHVMANERDVVIQKFPCEKYIQLWREGPYSDKWLSRNSLQSETALLFKSPYRLKDRDDSVKKCFVDNNGDTSDDWRWIYIHDKVTIVDDKGDEKSFYNRIGYNQITTRLYENLIRYHDGGFIRHRFWVDPEVDSEMSVEYLPVIWSRDDILAYHFDVKKNDVLVPSMQEIETIEFKKENGRFAKWDSLHKPLYGVVTLRVTIKGRAENMRVVYLKSLDTGEPLVRDIDNNNICYYEKIIHDDIEINGVPINPVITLRLGEENDYFELDVWRPTDVKEIIMDGVVVCYSHENVKLPYVLKDEVVYDDFGSHGYQRYDCANLGSIYLHLSNLAFSHMKAWEDGKVFPAVELDSNAPESLKIVFGNKKDDSTGKDDVKFYYWDYDKDNDPVETKYNQKADKNTVVFQSLEKVDGRLTNHYPDVKPFPFGYRKLKERMSYVDCFETAVKHRLYFFMFEPFNKLENPEEFKKKIYESLMLSRNNELTKSDRRGLLRLADEFKFDWEDLGVSLLDKDKLV